MESSVRDARFRLAGLWLSQAGRIGADHCLRIFVVLLAAEAGSAQREAAWHLVVALFVLPAVFLAPLNGAISNSLPKRAVVIGSASYCLAVVAYFAILGDSWLVCVGLVAPGWALYSPARYAMLPAAAHDAHLPLARVNGWIEMGSVLAIVGGMILGGRLYHATWPEVAAGLGDGGTLASWASFLDMQCLPVAIGATLALSLLGLLAALPVRFVSDVRRPEPAGQAVQGFFRDSRRILQLPKSRGSLLAVACFRGLVAAVTGAFVANVLSQTAGVELDVAFHTLIQVALWIMAGTAAGSLLAGLQGHPLRSLGLVPIGATGLLVSLAWATAISVPWWLCLVVGVMAGLINVPLMTSYQASLPADARGNGMAVLNMAGYVLMAAMSFLMFGLARSQWLTAPGQLWLVTGLTAVGAFVAWRILYRESLEAVTEVVLWPLYRVRGHGPGLERFPPTGPVFVVANHSAWFDPLWLGTVLPRRIIPMMTSLFYDLPVLRWLMVHVVHAIRVQCATYRREAPELEEAIAALDQGECVVIFPEGRMRRRLELPLRQFGQGVWHILRERPNTPVVACWIEGGWGSYTSYCGGPPLKNKHPRLRRHIDVAVAEPIVLEPSLLADQRAARAFLMKACLEARRFLDLEPLPQGAAVEDESSKEED